MFTAILKPNVWRIMRQLPPWKTCISQNFIIVHNQRSVHSSKAVFDNYEGDGKTTVTILNREHRDMIMFDSYSNFGFRMNNGIFVFGPMAVFPKTILQWNVHTVQDITPETVSLFYLLEPKLDILVFGTGDKRVLPSPDVIKLLKSKNIGIEVLSTEMACTTFNFLNVEGRYVAGAIIPPSKVVPYKEELKLIGESEELESLIPTKAELRGEFYKADN